MTRFWKRHDSIDRRCRRVPDIGRGGVEDGSHMDRYGQYVKGPEGGLREVRGAVVCASSPQAFRRAVRAPFN